MVLQLINETLILQLRNMVLQFSNEILIQYYNLSIETYILQLHNTVKLFKY